MDVYVVLEEEGHDPSTLIAVARTRAGACEAARVCAARCGFLWGHRAPGVAEPDDPEEWVRVYNEHATIDQARLEVYRETLRD